MVLGFFGDSVKLNCKGGGEVGGGVGSRGGKSDRRAARLRTRLAPTFPVSQSSEYEQAPACRNLDRYHRGRSGFDRIPLASGWAARSAGKLGAAWTNGRSGGPGWTC